jgi:hypothetical protein
MGCCGDCFEVCACIDHVEIYGSCEARRAAWDLEDNNFTEE